MRETQEMVGIGNENQIVVTRHEPTVGMVPEGRARADETVRLGSWADCLPLSSWRHGFESRLGLLS
jgi:hypothetical protein